MTTATCTCWCESTEQVIPVEWISEGRTKSCDLPGCLPGCETRADDAFEDPHVGDTLAERPPKRVTTHDYDVNADSSPGTAHLRAAYPGLILNQNPTGCECGCGEDRSKKARFRPGHDARLKGKLQRALASELDVWLVGPDGTIQHTNAEAVAAYHGWAKIVATGADRIRRRSQTPVAAEKRLARIVETEREGYTLLSFGRWDKTGRAMAAWTTPNGNTEVRYVTPEGTIEELELPGQEMSA